MFFNYFITFILVLSTDKSYSKNTDFNAISNYDSSYMLSPSQDNIDLAMKIFGIKVPFYTHYPQYQANLVDRGVTQVDGLLFPKQVYIGPAAFQSLGILGSTLAHELEVHARQSFIVIYLLDLFGFNGKSIAEREAYSYEIRNRDRFELTHQEVDQIRFTMDFYYR